MIYVGLTFALLLWFTKKTNQAANRFLAGALGAVVLCMAWILAHDIRQANQLNLQGLAILAVTLTCIAVMICLKPKTPITESPPEPPAAKPSPSAELVKKGVWLKKTMEANRYYRAAELSLPTLAEALNINPHELSRIINNAIGKNFNDFINEYRIREVVKKMQDPANDRITLLGIALDAGFNSKTTFNRTFKEMTGKSPNEYKLQLKKQRPSYNLEPRSRRAAVNSGHKAIPTWSYDNTNRNYMFSNYLKLAWRNLVKNKVYSTLNIVGLGAGMAVALLIGLWVVNQFSYDRFLTNYHQIYQVDITYTDPHTGMHTQPAVCAPMAGVLRNTIPGFKHVAETDWVGYTRK